MNQNKILDDIHTPDDLTSLDETQLLQLADEMRAFLIDSVSQTGGHLSANLGVVELTIALHKVFNAPKDNLVWDVGHQSYPHKILTGRKTQMNTLRQYKGLSGFNKRAESHYDDFGVGHSSTSISAALGMALSAKYNGEDKKSIAIIGDGAMGAGMAFEAMNHAGDTDVDLLVVLNDNEMSISPNVGALSNYLTRLLSSPAYNRVRNKGKNLLAYIPFLKRFAKRFEEHSKGMITPSTLFEELGFLYFGPVDGHDLPTLLRTLENLKIQTGPRLLHVITKKGMGYEPAEDDPCRFHGVNKFDPRQGEIPKNSPSQLTYTQIFSKWLVRQAKLDKKLMAITPAMREGSGLVELSEQCPEQYIDVGIAEQHAVTLGAGIACEGLKPVVAIYSTFLQRAYDQVIHDVAIQNLDVTFAIDRAGLVGADGATHAGSFDISYLRCIPNMVIMTPATGAEMAAMLSTAYDYCGPAAIRYPRGSSELSELPTETMPITLGKGEIIQKGQNVALLNFGTLFSDATQATKNTHITLANMRFVKPLDEALVLELANQHDHLITLEDNASHGGAGAAVMECLHKHHNNTPVTTLGIPDNFIEHGDQKILYAMLNLDADGLTKTINTIIETL